MSRYLITFEASPAAVPAIVRVRKLLKFASRALGLRCVRLVEENPSIQRISKKRP